MLNIPALRWGTPYESLETEDLAHFLTGEPVAKVAKVNAGLLARDLRKAEGARRTLCEIHPHELIERLKRAADLYLNATLPIGDGEQSPAAFAEQQSATTGMPIRLCQANMQKIHFVLSRMDQILDALTRGLDLEILTRGHGVEARGVPVSYQAQSPILGMVLPSNSPGVHTLWLPVVALQMGLVMKPGSQEPWTPYRVAAAFAEAGIPREVISIYPGGHDVGGEIVNRCGRAMIFGGPQTVEQYRGNPRIQVHGPGFSKILLGDDCVDDWEKYLDVMVDSVAANAGRGCINCSGIWASRHTEEIAQALAARMGPVDVLPPEDENCELAAFTVPGQAKAIHDSILGLLKEDGVQDMTEPFGPRLVERDRCGYLRPCVVHCQSPQAKLANQEYMSPFVSVVRCPQEKMIEQIGYTLVGSAITRDAKWQQALIAATNIDRLNFGPVPTIKLDWLQPHEGNIIEFLFRARAFQQAEGW